ncbi:MAG TPA: sodium:proton antiporter [Gammaproteobacteria bacterium]|nr:sodium:proton antiporter [Gammaproteobacteria bacterium]
MHDIIGVLLVLTAISSYINYKFIKLPKSIGITLVTLLLTVFATLTSSIGWGLQDVVASLVDSIGFNETFLHGMLSFMLFAGSLHVNLRDLYKNKYIILLFATVSVIISTILIGYGTFYLTSLLHLRLPLTYCFVFGALISPTDPIAVLGILKHIGVPKSLELKIAGEALFNDGMGIVLFFLALAIANGQQQLLSASDISMYFLQQAGGGLLAGAILGWIAAWFMHSVNDFEVEIILTLALVTGGYTLMTSVLDVSGPICMAVAGLIVGEGLRTSALSRDSVQKVFAFWDLLDEVLNAILFVLIGLEFMLIRFNFSTSVAALGAIAITVLSRWISVFIPVSFATRFRKFNPHFILIMTWGGLRGGISIALALAIDGQYHDMIVSITYGVVLFSIVVQGLTIGPLIAKIAPEKLSMRRK